MTETQKSHEFLSLCSTQALQTCFSMQKTNTTLVEVSVYTATVATAQCLVGSLELAGIKLDLAVIFTNKFSGKGAQRVRVDHTEESVKKYASATKSRMQLHSARLNNTKWVLLSFEHLAQKLTSQVVMHRNFLRVGTGASWPTYLGRGLEILEHSDPMETVIIEEDGDEAVVPILNSTVKVPKDWLSTVVHLLIPIYDANNQWSVVDKLWMPGDSGVGGELRPVKVQFPAMQEQMAAITQAQMAAGAAGAAGDGDGGGLGAEGEGESRLGECTVCKRGLETGDACCICKKFLHELCSNEVNSIVHEAAVEKHKLQARVVLEGSAHSEPVHLVPQPQSASQ